MPGPSKLCLGIDNFKRGSFQERDGLSSSEIDGTYVLSKIMRPVLYTTYIGVYL
jgi:hypothetical protein